MTPYDEEREREREREPWECDVGERKLNKKYQNIFSTYNCTILLLEQHYSNCQIYLAFDTSLKIFIYYFLFIIIIIIF